MKQRYALLVLVETKDNAIPTPENWGSLVVGAQLIATTPLEIGEDPINLLNFDREMNLPKDITIGTMNRAN